MNKKITAHQKLLKEIAIRTNTSCMSSNCDKGILIVNSIPKSGTYLVSLLLSELGLINSHLHFRNELFWNFKDKPLNQIIADADQYREQCKLQQSLLKVQQGEFCLAHFEYNKSTEDLLNSVQARHVFLVRNLRDVIVSSMRFISDSRRKTKPKWANETNDKKKLIQYLNSFGAEYLRSFSRQANWIDKSSVVTIRFEDILGDNGHIVQNETLVKLCNIAQIFISESTIQEILENRVFGKKTRTFSGVRSNIFEYWSDEAENIFKSHLGQSLNQRFEYE